MLKLIGAALVLFAGTMIGFAQGARFAERPRQIRHLLHALQRLETEIGYGQTPLPEALQRVAQAIPKPLSALFAQVASALRSGTGVTVRECWERTFADGWPSTSMRGGEREALLRLGATLGGSGKEDQLKHVRLAMLQLQAEETAAREEQQKYEKLSRSLGVLGAALVVILML
ncbi:stage III sporulation protein SpoIIIAB [Cohnella lubricantis]|uniref:Stage III sporulation protein AB n=1 Tax=Cohnella lubricantis TaxID=2163172 RepID=A0A841T8J8_9BACL|nr:stage III sporulation protein SpoIIIAB [Cohnella lubricantis]MBB6676409.1 stage III sporulation protein AB [Cohnella lubricantis]MBP2117584.1 stage III sporulation protein AB [Cohnella lubricantis]